MMVENNIGCIKNKVDRESVYKSMLKEMGKSNFVSGKSADEIKEG
jgi:hypothetical protein